MEEDNYNKIMTVAILIVLVVLSFFLLRPILLSVVFGMVLAIVFNPFYLWIKEKVKSKNLAASIPCVLILLAIILPIWFFTPILIDESIKVYTASQQVDFIKPLKAIFPSFFASDQFSTEIGNILRAFITKTTNYIMNLFSDILLDFPTIVLQSFVIFFIFFFMLRDQDELLFYLKSLLPFSKEIEKKLFAQSKDITNSVFYGQIVVGLVQGILVGTGLFLFGVSNVLFLTLATVVAGILPLLGPAIIWVPIVIFMVVAGNNFEAVGVAFFGLIASLSETFIKPIVVSRRTQMHSSIVLVGMVGGLFLFGVLGFILGPLILAYLFIVLEIYRNKKLDGIFQTPKEENKKA